MAFDHIGHLLELHAEAQVGLVAAVEAHGVVPGHAGELAELDALHLLEEVLGQAFEHVQHILLVHEAHLAVDLRELRLAVGAQVLVAEATHNLEVAVVTGHHQQLFEGLGALRQGVELAGIHTAGHHKVAGTLGRALDEHGGLNLQEIPVGKVVAYKHSHLVAHLQIAAHRIATDIQIAVLHAEVVAAIALVLNGEGGRLGLVEDRQFGDLNLDVTCRNLVILRTALDDLAGHLQHIFAAQFAGSLAEVGVGFHIESQLRDAIAVAQVDKSHAAEVAATLQPPAEGDSLSQIGKSQLATSICPIHIVVCYFYSIKLIINANRHALLHGGRSFFCL